MAVHIRRRRARRGAFRRGAPGFTVMELLVALAVLSVGTGIFISLFNTSLDMAKTSSHRIVASQLGEAQLRHIVTHPDQFFWFYPDTPLFAIKETKDEDPPDGVLFEPPGIAPGTRRASANNEKLYGSLRWRAYGRYPRDAEGALVADPAYVEVILEVRWKEAERWKALAFTSITAAAMLPEATREKIPEAAPEADGAEEEV